MAISVSKAQSNPAHTSLRVMGLMSGTSVDGIDSCLVDLIGTATGGVNISWIGDYTHPIPAELQERLKAAGTATMTAHEFCSLHNTVGALFAQAVEGLLTKTGVDRTTVDCIGSHGQTIYHHPPGTESGPLIHLPGAWDALGGTLQIGESAIMAHHTGIPVVSDFRVADMAVGGHGAPLVPFVDRLLFYHAKEGRCLQNIGGIGNVTVLPPGDGEASNLFGFDTGPGNMLMDSAMGHFYGLPFDEHGAKGRAGTVHPQVLTQLMTDAYLSASPPKSTGRERFGREYFLSILEWARNHGLELTPDDWMATLTQFTADSITHSYAQFVAPRCTIDRVIVSGGGAYNPILLAMMAASLEQRLGQAVPIDTVADYSVSNTYKEALAFALLAWATWHGLPGNVPGVTGAQRPVVLGKITPV